MLSKIFQDFGMGGINSDIPPWQVAENELTDAMNFRIKDQDVATFFGYTERSTLSSIADVGLLKYANLPLANYWIALHGSGISQYNGSTWSALTMPASFAIASEEKWDAALLSTIPIFNNPGWGPLYWDTTGNNVINLPFDGTYDWTQGPGGVLALSCQVMRSHQQFLFALNMQEGSTELPDVVRWSHPAAVGSLPDSWDETDTSKLAGKVALAGDSGPILDGLSLRNSFVVYRERGISIFDRVDDELVWNIRDLTTTASIANKNCLVEVKGNHLFISDGDILINNGNQIDSMIHKKLRNRLRNNINQDAIDWAFVFRNDIRKEVWFCVPEGTDSSQQGANVAYIWNWKDDNWSIRDLPDVRGLDYGFFSSGARTWDAADIAILTWDTITGLWSQGSSSVFDKQPMGMITSGSDSELIELETNLDGGSYSTYLEKSDIVLGDPMEQVTVNRLIPIIEGTSTVKVILGWQERIGGSINWSDPVDFVPGTDKYVDIRATGVAHAVRFYTDDLSTFWSISGVEMVYTKSGRR